MPPPGPGSSPLAGPTIELRRPEALVQGAAAARTEIGLTRPVAPAEEEVKGAVRLTVILWCVVLQHTH